MSNSVHHFSAPSFVEFRIVMRSLVVHVGDPSSNTWLAVVIVIVLVRSSIRVTKFIKPMGGQLLTTTGIVSHPMTLEVAVPTQLVNAGFILLDCLTTTSAALSAVTIGCCCCCATTTADNLIKYCERCFLGGCHQSIQLFLNNSQSILATRFRFGNVNMIKEWNRQRRRIHFGMVVKGRWVWKSTFDQQQRRCCCCYSVMIVLILILILI